MGFGWSDLINKNPTNPLNWARMISGGGGGGGGSGYLPLPTENPNNAVDQNQIRSVYQQVLGRTPTQAELEHFSGYVKSGDLDYNDIGNVLGGLPESQRARLDEYSGAYGQKLAASDNEILGRAGDAARSQAARLGRSDSSMLDASLASAGRDLALGRQSALASFYGNGLQNVASAYAGQGQSALARAYQTRDSRTEYNRSLVGNQFGYQQQKNDYNQYLNAANDQQQQQALFGLAGAGLGAAAGAAGGPAGAMAGAKFGAGIGGLFGQTVSRPRY